MRLHEVLLMLLTVIVILFATGYMLDAAPATPDKIQAAYDFAEHTDAKLMIIHYGASWCQPCREVERLYGEKMRSAGVYLHLDIDQDAALMQAHGIARPVILPAIQTFDWKPGEIHPTREVHVGLPRISVYVQSLHPHPPLRVFVGLPRVGVYVGTKPLPPVIVQPVRPLMPLVPIPDPISTSPSPPPPVSWPTN